jgi:polar amino acid transport system substrate-binding protein
VRATALALVFLALGSACRATSKDELVWGGDIQGGEPYAFEDPADPSRIIGFEVDIVDDLARRLGVRARFRHCAWSNLVPSLERGDFDMIVNGLEATPERDETLLLSRPYFVYAETLAIRKGSMLRTLEALAHKRVGTLNQTYARDLLQNRPLEIVLYEGGAEPYLDLAAGRIDAVLLDNIVADRFGCKNDAIECVPEDVARGTYVVGMRKSDGALKAAVDGGLEAMIADGSLRRILEKWKLFDARQADPIATRSDIDAHPRSPLDARAILLFFEGSAVTLYLATASFLLAMVLGSLLAIVRTHGRRTRGFASAYIELFRGTPLLLQLYLIYYGLAPIWKLDAVSAAILGLGLNYAAYEAEVYRGALQSLPKGQSEAAHALGLGTWGTLRHVLFPQALRAALPAMTNDFVALLKDTSIVSVIAVVELTKRTTITAVDVRSWLVPGIACAALYFAISFPLAKLSQRLERRLHV